MHTLNYFNQLPLVTDFPSRKQWETAVWEILLERLARVQDANEFKKAFQLLFGPYEKRLITYRALIASRINSGIGASEIGRELWVSRATISAVRKSLKESNDYASSHARGHKTRKITPTEPKPKTKFYRNTKFGPMIDPDRMQ